MMEVVSLYLPVITHYQAVIRYLQIQQFEIAFCFFVRMSGIKIYPV